MPGQVVKGAVHKAPKGSGAIRKATPLLSKKRQELISVSEDDNPQQMDDGRQYTSPKSDYINKMRQLEEEELKKCNGVLLKMKSATARQRNISNDVKNGLEQLIEVMEVIASYRNNWLKVERIQRSTDRIGQGTPSLLKSTRKWWQ